MVNTKVSNKPTPDEDVTNPDVPSPEPRTAEVEAAEQHPDTAEATNPVGEATQHESKDPYAEGQHIANPEPNNGSDGEDAVLPSANQDPLSDEELDKKTADTVADQKHVSDEL